MRLANDGAVASLVLNDQAGFLRPRDQRFCLGKITDLFAIGVAGVVSYDYGLSDAHPIIIAAILDLSPFWAALVALIISRKAIPVSPLIFFS